MVIGGGNGIGLSIALELQKRSRLVTVVDKEPNPLLDRFENIRFCQANLLEKDYGFLEDQNDIDTLVITAGFDRIAPFEELLDQEIQNSFQVNSIAALQILHHFFPRMKQKEPFHCAVMGSIAGLISSPLFATYSATKAALCNAIESLNIELEMAGTDNRILNVSPGSIKGTRFRRPRPWLSTSLEEWNNGTPCSSLISKRSTKACLTAITKTRTNSASTAISTSKKAAV